MTRDRIYRSISVNRNQLYINLLYFILLYPINLLYFTRVTCDFTLKFWSILFHLFDLRHFSFIYWTRFLPGLSAFTLIYTLLLFQLFIRFLFVLCSILFIYSIYSIVLVYFTLIYSSYSTLVTRDFIFLLSYLFYSICLTHDTFYLFSTLFSSLPPLLTILLHTNLLILCCPSDERFNTLTL